MSTIAYITICFASANIKKFPSILGPTFGQIISSGSANQPISPGIESSPPIFLNAITASNRTLISSCLEFLINKGTDTIALAPKAPNDLMQIILIYN